LPAEVDVILPALAKVLAGSADSYRVDWLARRD
jgi:hypothetical protein